MRVIKKICAFIYLLAAIVVLGFLTGLTFGPFTGRFDALLERDSVRAVLAVCLVVLALGALVTVVATFAARREPTCVHPDGNPDIEVSVAALESIARRAAESQGILVESVRGRVMSADRSQVRFTIEAIAFADAGLKELAEYLQGYVAGVCNEMLGSTGVSVLVRFLPSKTTIVTKEAPRERA